MSLLMYQNVLSFLLLYVMPTSQASQEIVNALVSCASFCMCIVVSDLSSCLNLDYKMNYHQDQLYVFVCWR